MAGKQMDKNVGTLSVLGVLILNPVRAHSTAIL